MCVACVARPNALVALLLCLWSYTTAERCRILCAILKVSGLSPQVSVRVKAMCTIFISSCASPRSSLLMAYCPREVQGSSVLDGGGLPI